MTSDPVQFRPVWGEVDLEAVRAERGRAGPLRRPRPAPRGRESRRVRPRRGTRRPGRARVRRDVARGGSRRGRRGAPRRRASTPRCSSCRSRRPRRPTRSWRRASPRSCTPSRDRGPRQGRCGRDRRHAAPRPPQGRHRDAPGRVPPRAGPGARRAGQGPSRADLEGLCTHLAVADEPDRPETAGQLDAVPSPRRRPRPGPAYARRSCTPPTRPGCSQFPESRFDLVRVGIALYGVPPSTRLSDRVELDPGPVPAGPGDPRPGPARRRPACRTGCATRSTVRAGCVTVPVGYADGVPRNLGMSGGEVLIGGRRYPIAGTVTMDQLMVDVGSTPTVEVGDEVDPARHPGPARRSPPRNGPSISAPSPTRSSAASAPAFPAGTSDERPRPAAEGAGVTVGVAGGAAASVYGIQRARAAVAAAPTRPRRRAASTRSSSTRPAASRPTTAAAFTR